MSTKTTLKRIALVAVSALTFGLLSSVPARAAGYTSSLSLGWSALTIVDSDVTNNFGYFYVDSTNLTGTTSTAAPIESGETITVSVIAAPSAARSVADLDIASVTNTGALPTTAFASATLTGGDGDESIVVDSDDPAASPNSSFGATEATTNESNRYWFSVRTDQAAAIGAGKYTIQVRLQNANSEVKDYTLTVKFVSSIADAGAVLTLSRTGSITTGVDMVTTANTSVYATLRDADGGRIQIGQAETTGTRVGWAPALNANMMASTTVGEDLTVADNGTHAKDHVTCALLGAAACTTSTATSITQAVSQASLAAGDGVYGVYDDVNDVIAASASSTSSVRVRVTNTSVSASITVPVITAVTAPLTAATVLLEAAGIALADQSAQTVSVSSGAATVAYTMPISATTAKITVDTTGTTAGEALTATTTWSGNYASSAVTPASANVQTLYTDASGKVVLNFTNTSPVATGKVSVKITGFATTTDALTVSLTWADSTVNSLSIVDPIAGVYAKTKASTVFTVKAEDQFGNALSGVQIQPSLGADSANYSATTKYAVITTGTNGTATFTLTDALAANDDEDNLTFTSVVGGKTATYDLTYKTTLPAASTLTGFQSSSQDAAESVAGRGVSISSAAGLSGTLVIARNISKSLSLYDDGATDDMYAIRIRAVTSTGAAATGASVTLTASTGGWVHDVDGLPASSRTVAVDASGDAYFRILATSTGTLRFTATSGTASFAFPLVIADQSNAAARFVKLTGAATGTSNGSGVPMTATVTDRYGNGVANVTLVATASGVGAFMGGQTSQSFTTDATGKYTFLATSYSAEGGAATFSVNATNATDADSVAGYSGANLIDSTVAAGNKAATATVTFAAGQNASQVAAEAATDAALEAIDAANAATDAANLAAEAADAATVAAEEARDAADAATAAVEALASEVATLIAGLKAQITTLANTVAKIAKKIRA